MPVLVDGDLIVTESRAMLQYLGSAYGKESFYPKDPKARAMVDQRLFFEATTLYGAFENAYVRTKLVSTQIQRDGSLLIFLE